MGLACCAQCLAFQDHLELREGPSGATQATFATDLGRAESFRTNPAVESFSEYRGEPQRESFQTIVPDRQSFNTVVPDRQSFDTLVPERQSFHTLLAVDSFSAYSQRSYRTLVP